MSKSGSIVLSLILLSSHALTQNIGIGTNNPLSKLSVKGNISIGTNFISSSAPPNGAVIEGNVGIGISNPQHKLDVDGNINLNGMLLIENCGGDFNNSDGLNGKTFFRVGGAGWDAMDNAGRFLSWDNVGPDRLRMKIPGFRSETASFEFYSNGVAGKIGGGSWAVFSDARLKEDVQDYSHGIDLIMKLRPVTFRYKKEFGGNSKQYVGLIAQEVEKVAPQLVFTSPNEKFKDTRMVDPSELLYTLINAVKEQQAEIDRLKKEIEALKKKE